jgi:hypothetical protein
VESPNEKIPRRPPARPGEGGGEQKTEGSAEEVLRPHGPVDVYCPCPFLEPGAECPFSLEIYSRDYVAYHLGYVGQPAVHRQPAPVALSGINLSRDAAGSVRITGVATNGNGFAVRNATIAGALIDSGGRIVGVGSTILLGVIAPGAGVPFDLRIEYEPYSRYQLYAQATQA